MQLPASPVFSKNWAALHEVCSTCNGVKSEPRCPDCYGSGRQYKIIENVGSSRSSKTWSFFQEIFLYAIGNRQKKIVVLRDTAVDCRELVETEFIDWMRDPCSRLKQLEAGEIDEDEYGDYLDEEDLTQHISENKTKHRHTFKATGSTIIFSGADNLTKVIGKGNDLVWVNEPLRFPEEVMLQLLKRVRVALLLDWNPDRDHYIERFRDRPDSITIHSTFEDNPFLDESVRKELLGSKPLLDDYYDFHVEHYLRMSRAEVEADAPPEFKDDILMCWDNEKHGTANRFHWEVYGLGIKSERPNRIFHWEEVPDVEFHSLDVDPIVCVDWGKVDPWGILLMKYHDGDLYLHELNYASENEIRSKMTTTEKAQIEGDDNGIVTWMFNRLGIDQSLEVVCDNNRPMKIAILRRFGWAAFAANKAKGSIIDGIDLLNNLTVKYTRSSINIAYEQENYSRKIDTSGEVLEEPEDRDNHLIDPARYGSLYLQSKGIIRRV